MNINMFFVIFLSLFLETSANGCCNCLLNLFRCKDNEIVERKTDTHYSSVDPLLHNVVSVSTCKPLTLTQIAEQEAQYNTVPVGDIVIIEDLKRQCREGRVFTQQDLQMCRKDTPEYRFMSQCLRFQMSSCAV